MTAICKNSVKSFDLILIPDDGRTEQEDNQLAVGGAMFQFDLLQVFF